MKYKKISQSQVLRHIKENGCSGDLFERMYTAKDIARFFNTSYYQANKSLKELTKKWYLIYWNRLMCFKEYESWLCDCENHLWEWWYTLSDNQ